MIHVNFFSNASDYNWLRQLPRGTSKIGNVKYYIDEVEKQTFDYWVFHGKITDFPKLKLPRSKTIFIATEPPNIFKYGKDFLDQFGLVISADTDYVGENVIRVQPGLNWHIGKNKNNEFTCLNDFEKIIPQKTKLCSVITSNKTGTIEYKRRLDFMEILKKELPDQVDLFGRGINEIDDKADALMPYLFNIVLENSDKQNYWTEKLSDPILTLTYPIYSGCKNIEEYFSDKELTVIDIEKPQDAIEKIRSLLEDNSSFLNQKHMIKAREKVLYKYNLFYQLAEIIENCHNSRMDSVFEIKKKLEHHYTQKFSIKVKNNVFRLILKVRTFAVRLAKKTPFTEAVSRKIHKSIKRIL